METPLSFALNVTADTFVSNGQTAPSTTTAAIAYGAPPTTSTSAAPIATDGASAWADVTVQSSTGQPFWVVSDQPFVSGVAPLSQPVLVSLLARIHTTYLQPTSIWGNKQLLIDFEGEMLGFGGMMTSAAVRFLNDTRTPGLFVDMETAVGIQLMRELLEAPTLQKLVWGAESDCAALLHQQRPVELGIRPVNLMDVQLMYSPTPDKRLSMKKALERIIEAHPQALAKLPPKDCIEWDGPYSRNERVLTRPLSAQHVTYAVDDLCRLELVLHHQMDLPPLSDFPTAKHQTEEMLAVWANDFLGTRWFWRQWRAYNNAVRKRHSVVDQNRRAVVLVRHLLEVDRRCEGDWKRYLSPSDVRVMYRAYCALPQQLARFGVEVPEDLGFCISK